MGLDRLVRTGLTAGFLGLTAMGAGACAPTLSKITEGEGLTLIGAVMGKSDDASARKLAPYISLLGQMRYQKEVTGAGRTQINIQGEQTQRTPENVIYSQQKYFPSPGFAWTNPETPNDLTVRRSIGMVFAANYWKDFNNDGLAEPNEFVGVKDRFYDTEKIILVLYNEAGQGVEREIRWEIYDPQGNLYVNTKDITTSYGVRTIGIDYDNKNSITTAMGVTTLGIDYDLMDKLLRGWRMTELHGGNLVPGAPITPEYGTYVIVWHSQGITETKQFEIIHSPTRENN